MITTFKRMETKVYKNPTLTVDSIVTRRGDQNQVQILLITRGKDPFKGLYAYPGGHVDYGEDPETACLRELREECHIEGSNPELICVAGKSDRDPRGHYVTIVYHVAVDPSHKVTADDDAASADWYDLETVVSSFEFAFDHREILQKFLEKSNILTKM